MIIHLNMNAAQRSKFFEFTSRLHNITQKGADPGFSFFLGGGGRKRFRQGCSMQGPLKGPGSSRVILSRAIWALSLGILIKRIDKKHTWSNFRGRLLALPPPWSATAQWLRIVSPPSLSRSDIVTDIWVPAPCNPDTIIICHRVSGSRWLVQIIFFSVQSHILFLSNYCPKYVGGGGGGGFWSNVSA